MTGRHHFFSTGEAYDAVQCYDDIKKGDTLIIISEGVVGLAWAWPVAITANCGDLHAVTDRTLFDDEFTPEQITQARAVAVELGYPLSELVR
jgi:hypothetical protein